MWERFRRKEPDIGALQKALGRFRRGTRATKRQDVVVVYGNAVRLGFFVLLIVATISLALWLLRRRRTREEEEAALASPPAEEGMEGVEAAGLPAEGEAVVMPEGLPLVEEPPPGEERPERRGIISRWRRGS
jgi:hypothetical protein